MVNLQLASMQVVNGIQFGMLLFMLSAGLTLVFGIMNFVNLAHGSLYMMGAYFGAAAFNHSGSFALAIVAGVLGSLLLGLLVDQLVLNRLYKRDHLDQVLCTFGLTLFFNEFVRIVWGPAAVYIEIPAALSGSLDIGGMPYPVYRVMMIGVGAFVAVGLYLVIQKTRFGTLIRAGACNLTMVSALGIDIVRLNRWMFGIGAAAAGLAGVIAGPLLAVQPGMGEPILILTLVVIVTGGIGSIRGAFWASLLIGVVDTVGRAMLPMMLRSVLDRATAQAVGPAVASILIFLLMTLVLALRPQGLFPTATR